MIFPLYKLYFDIAWHKFEKRWADVFQIYPNAIHLSPLQFLSIHAPYWLSSVLFEFFYSLRPLFSYFSQFYDHLIRAEIA